MSLNTYLKDRKNNRIKDLLIEHAGRCKAVGNSFFEASEMMIGGRKNDLNSRVAIIKTEERSADEVEAKINREVAASSLPIKLSEELLYFVRTLDRAAGAAKRAVINFSLISDYTMPTKYAKQIGETGVIIKEMFEIIGDLVKNLEKIDYITEKCRDVNLLESKIDKIYTDLKEGYFEIEKSFESAAALIILDHAFRDLEAVADFGEDASEILMTLVSRRG